METLGFLSQAPSAGFRPHSLDTKNFLLADVRGAERLSRNGGGMIARGLGSRSKS
jgi:hypothetical protein